VSHPQVEAAQQAYASIWLRRVEALVALKGMRTEQKERALSAAERAEEEAWRLLCAVVDRYGSPEDKRDLRIEESSRLKIGFRLSE
jgi:hypothetical protein